MNDIDIRYLLYAIFGVIKRQVGDENILDKDRILQSISEIPYNKFEELISVS